jgi:hypothetical protein
MYVCKALATVFLIRSLHVILLSKLILRCYTVYKMGYPVCLNAIGRRDSKPSGKIECPRFPISNLYFPAHTQGLRCSKAGLQFAENMASVFLCHISKDTVCKCSKVSSSCHRGIVYIRTVQYWSKDETLGHPCYDFSRGRKFAFY